VRGKRYYKASEVVALKKENESSSGDFSHLNLGSESYSVKQTLRRLGVRRHETLRSWTVEGLLPFYATPGKRCIYKYPAKYIDELAASTAQPVTKNDARMFKARRTSS
jgi:hypothetical protein